MKKTLAIFVGKLTTLASRLLRFGGGSSLPGLLALRIEPEILQRFFENNTVFSVVVTGSNGKTTTSRMIAGVMRENGRRVIWNRSGANLVSGIVSALIEESDLRGRLRADAAVFEVDEATLRHVVKAIRPSIVLITNCFRDQLDRYGEVDMTLGLIREALLDLPPESAVILNADDPLVAGLASGLPCKVRFYGLGSLQVEDETNPSSNYQPRDVRNCLKCGAYYRYTWMSYGHLGDYHCPKCGASRPNLDFRAQDILLQGADGSVFNVAGSEGADQEPVNLSLGIPGLYNVYNGLAAAACCLTMALPPALIRKAISNISSAFGRMETIRVKEKKILLALVKNPVGLSEVIRTLAGGGEQKTLILCLNDNYADGRDISWIWDADVELLAENPNTLRAVVASGIRAWDMALRLKYAGIPADKITIEPDMDQALKIGLSKIQPGETLFILPTYTALLRIRELIRHLSHTREFWQT